MSTTSSPHGVQPGAAPAHRSSSAPYIVMIIVGAVVGMAGLMMATITLAAGWASVTQGRDGLLTSPPQRYTVSSYAITSTDLTVLSGDLSPVQPPVASTKLQATSSDPSSAVFVGIGPTDQVQAYLRDVPRSELVGIETNPFRPIYRTVTGTQTPGTPGVQDFWAVSSEGTGTQSVEADVRSGHWTVVIMNANGAANVSVDVNAGVHLAFLVPMTAGLTGVTLLLLVAGVVLIVGGAAGLGDTSSGSRGLGVGTTAAVSTFPAHLRGVLDAPSRWQWLVKWLLLIPHVFLLVFLWLALALSTIVAFFAILITARYPRALFDFAVGVLRWTWRVSYYTYSALGTDRYPPFSLTSTAYPASLDVDYPARLSRGLVLVKSWLLAIPQLIVVGLLTSPWYLLVDQSRSDTGRTSVGISLLGLLVLVAAISLLFRSRYPRPLFDLVMGINRWVYRVLAYVLLLTDAYPPFRLDQGSDEPGIPSPAAASSAPAGGPQSTSVAQVVVDQP